MDYNLIDWKTKAQEIGVYGFVYIIANALNDKKYIGITTDSLYDRYCGHVSDSKSQREVMLLARAIHKHGRDNFKITCIGVSSSKQELENFEKEAIIFYNSHVSKSGYNVSWGGFSNGKHSEETKKKISETKRSQKLNISDDHKAAISKANKGIKKTPQHIEKVNKANKGKKRSHEYCLAHKKQRQQRYGKPVIAVSPDGTTFKFLGIHEASRQLKLPNRKLISLVARGVYKQYKGWQFKYANIG